MSIENVNAFVAKTESDDELQERLAKIATQSELTPEALVRLGEEVGLPFTVEEFLEVGHQHVEAIEKGLSDAALESVSGGLEPAAISPNRASSPSVVEKLKALGKYREKNGASFETVDPHFLRPMGDANPS